MLDFYVLTGFENVVSKIDLDRSSLACTDVTGRFSSMRRFDLTHSICVPFQHLFSVIKWRARLNTNPYMLKL